MAKAPKNAHEIKIAYIGGGSRNWARFVMTDLALCPHLKGQIALYDINYAAAQENVKLGRKLFGHKDAKTKFTVEACEKLPDALKGADFVFLSIQPGPVQMFANDIDIPAKYGILQTVGDTMGPGGISRALRAIPPYVEFAHQIMKHCPDAWAINYTNPMTVCTRTLYAAEPDIKAFGCCHEVFGTQNMLAGLVEKYLKVKKPDRREIKVDPCGVNHFTWVTKATWQGQDLFPLVERQMDEPGFWDDRTEWSLKQKADGEFFKSQNLIKYEFYRRFGALGAAGDRHLVEFVPWYLTSEETLHRWGVVLTPSSFRLGKWKPLGETPAELARKKAAAEGKALDSLRQTGEEGVAQMCAILGIGDLDTNVNLPNRGQMPDLPNGVVVESNALFRHGSVTPVTGEPMPDMPFSFTYRIVSEQEMILQAGMEKDFDLALQALLSDPLCMISTDAACAMLKEMLQANKKMMRGWKL